jgi:hypothetical protein
VASREPAEEARPALGPVIMWLVGVVLALSVAAVLLFPDQADRPARSAAVAGGSTAAGRQPAPTTAAGPQPAPTTAWRSRDYPAAGFAIRVPAGWRSSEQANRVVLRAPDGAASVAVSWTEQPLDPLAELKERAAQFRSTPGYRELALGEARRQGRPAAEWEYVAPGPGGGVHGLALAVSGGGRGYVMTIEAPEVAWAAARPTLERIGDGLTVG